VAGAKDANIWQTAPRHHDAHEPNNCLPVSGTIPAAIFGRFCICIWRTPSGVFEWRQSPIRHARGAASPGRRISVGML